MFDLTSPVPNETVCAKVAIEAVKFFVRELLMDMFNKVLTGLGYQATHTDASFLLRQNTWALSAVALISPLRCTL